MCTRGYVISAPVIHVTPQSLLHARSNTNDTTWRTKQSACYASNLSKLHPAWLISPRHGFFNLAGSVQSRAMPYPSSPFKFLEKHPYGVHLALVRPIALLGAQVERHGDGVPDDAMGGHLGNAVWRGVFISCMCHLQCIPTFRVLGTSQESL